MAGKETKLYVRVIHGQILCSRPIVMARAVIGIRIGSHVDLVRLDTGMITLTNETVHHSQYTPPFPAYAQSSKGPHQTDLRKALYLNRENPSNAAVLALRRMLFGIRALSFGGY